ncbi:MAG TPA: GFA family protein [Gammaproteobacteria bacterium]
MSSPRPEPQGDTQRGGCLCGAVRYEVRGPYRWMAHCHCSLCRRHHGALFSTSLGVDARRFRWLAGEADIVHYRASPAFARPFCRVCGAKVPTASQLSAVVNVPAGTLDGDVAMRPRTHIFAASKSPATVIADGLRRFDAYPPATGWAPPPTPPRADPPAGVISASCLCGAVAYRLDGALGATFHCHCAACRRSTGAAHATWSAAAPADLRWMRGADLVASHRPSGTHLLEVRFCGACGSLLPASGRAHGRVLLPVGALDGLDGTRGGAAGGHAHAASKAPWHEIADDLPRYEAAPPPAARWS